ncbi:probable potassium transporter 13 [Phalaenopsis equestris]|uniref:probable potassium transporter 13 n=1 Tax=Phalaenopsis equestris TaxID=78828 RepID=UPI0009E3DEDD|nr:probable potassium transporter 13 [Phalaenopsis equestris]
MDFESGTSNTKAKRVKVSMTTFWLAYQSLGVVYGDLSISPIFVYNNIFSGRRRLSEDDTEILGVLSMVFWTLTLIALLKYIVIVLGADDNGEGGVFALYSRLCRSSKLGLINTSIAACNHLPVFEFQKSPEENKTSLVIKGFFEKHQRSRVVLFFIVLLGTGMLIADGALTPSMSVLSAISGLRVKVPELHENYTVVISCFILAGLFTLQQYGTHRVGFLFAPVLITWMGCLGMMGMYNIFKWNPAIVRALSPYYIYKFLRVVEKDQWSSLGGIALCITGAEAMFADLGHFSKLSLRIAFSTLVFPCLVIAYMGEAAFLSKHEEDPKMSFYKSIPENIFWPVYVIATIATIAASQPTISATFSIINQCRALNCFPRVKIIHTSNHVLGQIYIPEINWLLMILCMSVTIGFRDTMTIGNAYELSVITVMLVTTCLMFLIITTVWNQNILLAILFTVSFGSVELFYLSACLAKLKHGGWLPLVLSLIILLVMSIWHYGSSMKLSYELQNKVHLDSILNFNTNLGLLRVPGICFVFSTIPDVIPPMFFHFITNFSAVHRIIIFVSMKTVALPRVPLEERFLVSRIGPKEFGFFGCIVTYGYKDSRVESGQFEENLLNKLSEFLLHEGGEVVDWSSDLFVNDVSSSDESDKNLMMERREKAPLRDEVMQLMEQREAGVAYMIGHTEVLAHSSSSVLKKNVINLVYGFMRRNCRQVAVALGIPRPSLMQVGIVYRV